MPRIITQAVLMPKVPEPTLAASRLEAMDECPGYVKDLFQKDMTAADDGKAIHAAIETGEIPEGFTPDQRAMVEWCSDVLANSAYRESPSSISGIEADVHHEYELHIPFIKKPGFIDVLILFDDGTASIIDWKTGRQKQEHPDHNLQFKAYACGLWMQNPALKSIEIIAAYPRLKVVERSTFTYPDFLASMEKLAEISWKSQNYTGRLTPNESCGRCGRASECPALMKESFNLVRVTGSELPANLDPANVPLDKPHVLAYLRDMGTKLDAWIKAVKDRANYFVKEMGMDLPGYRLTTRKGSRKFRNGNDVAGMIFAVEKELGKKSVAMQDLLAKASFKVDDIEELVEAAYGPQGLAKFHEIAEQSAAIDSAEDTVFLTRDKKVRLDFTP
jgi:hypothetical protein